MLNPFLFCVPEESSIPEMSIELSMLDKLKTRVQLARKIENARHKINKTNHDRKWMKETAETLGVDLDSDFIRYLNIFSKKINFYLGYSLVIVIRTTRKKFQIKNAKRKTVR
jgi:hypothetical protein